MPESAEELLRVQKYLEKEREPWDTGIWREISLNFNTLREDMWRDELPAKKQGIRLYDGTPVSALNLFADGLHGALISPAITWFVMRLPRKFRFLEDIPQVRIWLQETQEGLYAAFANSNFYSEMRPYFRDGGSIGTASITCEEDIANSRLIFRTRHPKEGYIALNQFGEVDTYYRVFKLTARQALQKFKDKNLFSSGLRQALDTNGDPYKKFQFLQAVYPRTEFDNKSISNRKKRFASSTIEFTSDNRSGSGATQPILKESGFDIFPVMVWRYFVNSPEVYGRSPCMFALTDAETLQTMARSHTRAGEIAADPAYNIPSEMAGRVRIGPHGMNYVGDDFNRIIRPVTQGGNYPISIDREDKKREMIEKHLHVDFFLMLAQAQRQMTAEEVRERVGEKATVLSAAIGDLTTVLDKIIDYVFIKELEAGRIPQPPDILIETMGGQRIDTDYLGPLAQSQKRLFERRGIIEGLETVAPLMEIYPEVRDEINPSRTARELLKAENFPEIALNTPEEKKAIKEQRAIELEQAERKTDTERTSEVLKNLSQAKKNAGGDLTELAEQITA